MVAAGTNADELNEVPNHRQAALAQILADDLGAIMWIWEVRVGVRPGFTWSERRVE